MKFALFSFAATALLLVTHLAPSTEALRSPAAAADIDFAVRHAQEQADTVEAELGLEHHAR
ncbi:MAG: hypothetical protein E6G94_04820 [Alphaproteobacteria bacterium]|nr:MAG: hypothetical protein E6G94_04820 [Alphaproteobacteria bacterium]